jgi:hypothetical protein
MSDSNYAAFAASLDRLADVLDFERDGLGQRILDEQAQRIADRMASGQGTKGKLKANRGEYGERKRAKGLGVGVGLKSSDDPLLSIENIRGDQVVTHDSASMKPGKSDLAYRKAQWLANGSDGTEGERSGAENQPERPWYGMTKDDAKDIRDECGKAVATHLRGH